MDMLSRHGLFLDNDELEMKKVVFASRESRQRATDSVWFDTDARSGMSVALSAQFDLEKAK